MSNTEESLIKKAAIKKLCENDFKFFVRYMFKSQKKSKFIFGYHHELICDKLMDVFEGRSTHLIINIPPRFGKTELVVKMFSAWCMMKNPTSEFIHLSYSLGLALSNSEAVNTTIKSDGFQELWPEISIKQGKDSKGAWCTEQGGVFYATAAGSAVTGFGAGKINEYESGQFVFSGAIIIDDALKSDDAYSDTIRGAVNRRWDETIKSRKNSKHTPVIVVMQRLHEDDFTGMLLNDSEYQWDQLVLPALLNEGEDNEQSLWPHKFTVEELRSMRDKNPYMFSSQMQQNPSPLGGGLFKDEYWQFYDALPNDLSVVRMYCDTAQKTKEHNDYSVFEVWGYSPSLNGIVLIDMMRGKWEAPQLQQNFIDFYAKHKPTIHKPQGVTLCKVEDKSSGSSLIQSIAQGGIIPIEGIQRNTDKVSRSIGALPQISMGRVYLPRNAHYLPDFLDECRKFTPTMAHKHDDQIDPMLDAIEDLLIFDQMIYSEAAL